MLLPLWATLLAAHGHASDVGWLAKCRVQGEAPLALGLTLDAELLAWRAQGFGVVRRELPPGPDDLLTTAQGLLGSPYVWGSMGPDAFDCSGFVNRVFAQNGYDLPRTSREIAKVGLIVSAREVQGGDLLFFVKTPGDQRITHVGIYAGNDQLIHAAQGKGEVTVDRLSSLYYAPRLVGVRRILTLPMGVYSDRRGLARAGVLFDEPGRVALVKPGTQQQDGGTEELLLEHTEPPPLGFAGTFVKGAVTQVGPRSMLYEATEVGLRLGATSSSDEWSLLAVPEASYFDHESALFVGVGVPVQIPIGGEQSFGELAEAQWSGAASFTRVLRQASFGQKEAPLYLDLGRTASGSLGHGQLMRYYTPNIASGVLPDYILERNALSLSADGFLDWGGAELFVDDVVAPRVLGSLAFARPFVLAEAGGSFLRSLSVAATYVTDVAAPYQRGADGGFSERVVSGAGVDVEVKPYKSDAFDWKLYLDGSALMFSESTGTGGALGTLLRGNLGGSRTHVLRARLEGRLSSPTFIPSYFDATYALNRRVAPVDAPGATPITKLELLEELAGTPSRWGVYGEIDYAYAKRLSLGLSYEDGGALGDLPAAASYVGRSLMLFAQLRNIYLSDMGRHFSLYFAYHLRNFERLWPILGLERANEYLFAAAALHLNRYVTIGAGLRKAFDTEGSGGAELDGLLDCSVRYEL